MKIEIENFTFKAIIGLLNFERESKQRVIINLTATYNYEKGNFIDYVKICKLIKKTIKKGKFKLLEDALLANKDAIVKEFPNIQQLYIKITKPDILKNANVSLSINYKL